MRKSVAFAAVLLVSLLASVFFVLRWWDAERRAARAEVVSVQPPYPRVLLHDLELAQLRKLGLEDPIATLRADLALHGSLIPFKGALGGTMAFYDEEGMVLLPGGYVYAPADDGHYLVHTVLFYTVEQGGKVHWKLLDAHPD